MLEFIRQQVNFVLETTSEVASTDDFVSSRSGMVLYNSTCMCLQTIGETVRKIDELTEKSYLSVKYPNIHWKSIIGMRNIISHEYVATDPQIIYNTVRQILPSFQTVIDGMLCDIPIGEE